MWTCTDIRQRAAAYFANSLTAAECQMLEQHLARCDRCRLELSEAYSGYRLAAAAFNAPDPFGGLSATRIGAIYAAGSGVAPVAAKQRPADLRRTWFVAAAAAVVVLAAWLGRPPEDSTLHPSAASATLRTDGSDGAVNSTVEVAMAAEHTYPASFGIIYPADYRAAGGFTPETAGDTVMIDFDSLGDDSFFVYDPAYGMGRTVITDGSHARRVSMKYYGLDGPKGPVRL